MLKILYFVCLVGFLYISYFDGLKPYFNALIETNRLYIESGIPLEKINRAEFLEKKIEILESKCRYGTVKPDVNTIRCASNAGFKMFK